MLPQPPSAAAPVHTCPSPVHTCPSPVALSAEAEPIGVPAGPFLLDRSTLPFPPPTHLLTCPSPSICPPPHDLTCPSPLICPPPSSPSPPSPSPPLPSSPLSLLSLPSSHLEPVDARLDPLGLVVVLAGHRCVLCPSQLADLGGSHLQGGGEGGQGLGFRGVTLTGHRCVLCRSQLTDLGGSHLRGGGRVQGLGWVRGEDQGL